MTDESYVLPERRELEDNINRLLSLLSKEESLKLESEVDRKKISLLLDQAFNPEKFEIVFAGRYSIGKSMLINCLLGRYFLRSSVGHTTAVECRIIYAPDHESEGAKLTYLSRREILYRINKLARDLNLNLSISSLDDEQSLTLMAQKVAEIKDDLQQAVQKEKADALDLLIEGFLEYEMLVGEDSNIQSDKTSLDKAQEWATDRSMCAVLKKIDYFCYNPLLKECTIVDLPGIDAPAAKDQEIAINKIKSDTTAAIVFLLGYVEAGGETHNIENEIISIISNSNTLRSRTFYVMNQIDQLWNNPDLQEKCEKSVEELADRIKKNSSNTNNIYQISALLDFYASMFNKSDANSEYGLTEFAKKGNIKDQVPFLDAFIKFFEKFYSNPKKKNNSSLKLLDLPHQNYIKIRNENEFSDLTDEILDKVGSKKLATDLYNYLTRDKKPELYNIVFREIEKLSYQLIRCYEQETSSINSISLEPNSISNEQKSLQRKQLKNIYQRIENTFNNQVHKIKNLQLNGTSNYLEFEALLQGINNYVMNEILQDRINQISFIKILNEVQKENGGKLVPDMSVIPESIFQIANEVEEYVIAQVQDFGTKFIDDLKKEITKDSIYSELGENLRTEINKRIFELLDSRKTIVNTSIESIISNDCKKCRKEHANFFKEVKNIGLESLFSNKIDQEKDAQIHVLLKAQFEQNFVDLFDTESTDQFNNVRQSILSVFTKQLRINNGNLGTNYEVINLEEKLNLVDLIETKLELDLSQEIQNRQKQKETRINRLSTKIGEYLQLKQEIESCFKILQTSCQLPEIEQITLDESEPKTAVYN